MNLKTFMRDNFSILFYITTFVALAVGVPVEFAGAGLAVTVIVDIATTENGKASLGKKLKSAEIQLRSTASMFLSMAGTKAKKIDDIIDLHGVAKKLNDVAEEIKEG